MQSEINIKIGNKSPSSYFQSLIEQIKAGNRIVSGIDNEDDLFSNLESNCIPKEIVAMEIDAYDSFLESRRKIMAAKIKDYYFSL